MIGRVIGNYRIEALLGRGGMGAVYRALDTMLDRTVAVKALRADAATQPGAVERFRMEARTLARLLHPNIATLYTLVRSGDDLYMVMEFCEGETFEAILRRRGRLAPAEALPLFLQALDGLEHAHRHGIVHRDIKPANLMRLPDGTVKVMDFGIARLLGSSRLTQTQHTIGTAAYMAPEQIRAQEVDARADVYALGVLLYELVAGRVPFQSESSFEVMEAHINRAPPPPRQFAPDLPEALEVAILRALAKAPDDRFSSVVALREALRALDLAAPLAEAETTVAPIPSRHEPEDQTEIEQEPASRSGSAPIAVESGSAYVPPAPAEPDATHVASPSPVRPPVATSAPPTVTSAAPRRDASSSTVVATPHAGRRLRRGAFVAAGLGLVLAVGVWAFATGPAPLDREPSDPDMIAPTETGALLPLSSDGPSAPNSDLASSLTVAAWVATAERHLEAGRLTTPADSNALLFAERALAADPDHAEAKAVVRRIVERSNALGQRARQRENLRIAREHFQQSIAVADRHPGVADEGRAQAQLALVAVRDDESAARNDVAAARESEPPAQSNAPAETPPAATGTIRVLARPFGDVYVDGQRRASGTNAPVFATVSPGTHRVRVTHPTFGTQERSVRVRADQTAEVFIEFAAPVQVTVVSDPINALILLDGRAMGRYTPATITIPAGRHTVEVRRDGYRPASRSVTIEAGAAPDRLAFTLTPER
ncbi:MAG: protein kinase [Rhodothermales bacterium]